MKHIVKFSGGKDSTAMLLLMLERSLPVDEIIFCDTGLEYPELYQHIAEVERYIGRQITVLHPPHSFEYFLADIKIIKGKHAGEHGYGWPRRKDQRWCTGRLKEKIATHYLKNMGDYKLYIGIAADEPARHYRESAKNIKHPLFTWGITEKMALDYCLSKGFTFGGLYDKFKRLGCWCCPFQGKKALQILRKDYPELWLELLRLDARSPNTFKSTRSVLQYERNFALQELQIQLITDTPAYINPVCCIEKTKITQQYVCRFLEKQKRKNIIIEQGSLF